MQTVLFAIAAPPVVWVFAIVMAINRGGTRRRHLVKILLWLLPICVLPSAWLLWIIVTWPDNGAAL